MRFALFAKICDRIFAYNQHPYFLCLRRSLRTFCHKIKVFVLNFIYIHSNLIMFALFYSFIVLGCQLLLVESIKLMYFTDEKNGKFPTVPSVIKSVVTVKSMLNFLQSFFYNVKFE